MQMLPLCSSVCVSGIRSGVGVYNCDRLCVCHAGVAVQVFTIVLVCVCVMQG